MPLNEDDFKNYSPVGFNRKVEIKGLDCFTKTLEKHFFSKVTVRNFSNILAETNLIIEVDCNFGLIEMLEHFNKDIWGNFASKEHSFNGALQKLRDKNNIEIEVEEFSIFLKNTSIIINKIQNQKISEQLENILFEMNSHFLYFTKGLYEIPYEIYLPVFEDHRDHISMDPTLETNTSQDYISFWGLYFYSKDDAVVYDLKNQTIIEGNLQMLNR